MVVIANLAPTGFYYLFNDISSLSLADAAAEAMDCGYCSFVCRCVAAGGERQAVVPPAGPFYL